MKSQITKILSEEHQNILKLIEILNKKYEDIQKGKPFDKEFFLKAIDFIKGYADKFHHAKEEDILFKEMCKKEIQKNMHCNPIDMMLHEHEQGRKFVKEMEEGIRAGNREKIINGAKEYSQLLQEHIFKEDNILYPMADEVLDNNIKHKMLGQFLEIEEKKKKERDKYLNFIKSIK